MNMVYDSDLYTVYEFGSVESHEALRFGGYEIMNKYGNRQMFIDGLAAARFKLDVMALIARQPSIEDIDEFLSEYDTATEHTLTLH